MTELTIHSQIPDATHRFELNAALHATGAETGFWDETGRPAPWPDDIEDWRPSTNEPITLEPDEQPF
jgi:hypothetical protein